MLNDTAFIEKFRKGKKELIISQVVKEHNQSNLCIRNNY